MLVDQYFNDSTGVGDLGEKDERGPWKMAGEWQMVDAPAFKDFESELAGSRVANGESSGSSKAGKRVLSRHPESQN